MDIIEVDRKAGMEMIKLLEVEAKCKYCGAIITEENFGGVFSKPTRLSCNNTLCLLEAIGEDEKNEKDKRK